MNFYLHMFMFELVFLFITSSVGESVTLFLSQTHAQIDASTCMVRLINNCHSPVACHIASAIPAFQDYNNRST